MNSIKTSDKTAVYVCCIGHQLNLFVPECITDTAEGENALEIFNKVSKFVTGFPKWLESFCTFKLSMLETEDNLNLTLRPLCPTRWVLQKASLDAILSNYEKLLDWWCDKSNSTDVDAKLKCQVESYLYHGRGTKCIFIFKLCNYCCVTFMPFM